MASMGGQCLIAVLVAFPGAGLAQVPVRVQDLTVVDLPMAESAKYDPARDVYYVSQMVGHPTAHDGDGRIARVSPTGTVERKFIGGPQSTHGLHAPKGLLVDHDTLWVVDIDALHGFLLPSGDPTRTIDLTGAGGGFFNSVARLPSGEFVITDTGLELDEGLRARRTERDRVLVVDAADRIRVVLEGPGLGAPNGIAYDPVNQALLYVTSAGDEVVEVAVPDFVIDRRWRIAPGLDGVALAGSDRLFVSSLGDDSVYELDRTTGVSVAIVRDRGAGDIGFDSTRNRLLLPLLDAHRFESWTVTRPMRGRSPLP